MGRLWALIYLNDKEGLTRNPRGHQILKDGNLWENTVSADVLNGQTWLSVVELDPVEGFLRNAVDGIDSNDQNTAIGVRKRRYDAGNLPLYIGVERRLVFNTQTLAKALAELLHIIVCKIGDLF
jgi:hypothetical protein